MGEKRVFPILVRKSIFSVELSSPLTDLVLFRKRIDEKEPENILQISIELPVAKAKKREVLIESTVQGKNITFQSTPKS